MSTTRQPPVLILIGPQGCGKTSDARLIANKIGGLFYDGDDAIPSNSWMKWQADKGLPVVIPQVRSFVIENLIPELRKKRAEAARQSKPLVVSQALFFNEDRYLIDAALGDNVFYFVVNTTAAKQKEQIIARCAAQHKGTWRTWFEMQSASSSNSYFQQPDKLLKSFQLTHLGAGRNAEFLADFDKFYQDILKLQNEVCITPGFFRKNTSSAQVLSSLQHAEQSESKAEQSKTATKVISCENLLKGGAVLTGVLALTFLAARTKPEDAKAIAEVLSTPAFTL